MFTKFQRCRGLKLFRWRYFQIELWYCPARETVDIHCHPNIDSTIVHLFGKAYWAKASEYKLKWNYVTRPGTKSTVPAGVFHGLVTQSSVLFLNIERWTCKPTSAAVNYKPL